MYANEAFMNCLIYARWEADSRPRCSRDREYMLSINPSALCVSLYTMFWTYDEWCKPWLVDSSALHTIRKPNNKEWTNRVRRRDTQKKKQNINGTLLCCLFYFTKNVQAGWNGRRALRPNIISYLRYNGDICVRLGHSFFCT